MLRARVVFLALLAVICVSAVSASAASAAEYEEILTVGSTLTAVAKGNQVLVATDKEETKKSVTVTCKALKLKNGKVKTKTEWLGKVEYEKCEVGGLTATVTNGCESLFHLVVGTKTATVDIVPAGCVIEIKVASTGCLIKIKGAQLGLKIVKLENLKVDTGENTGEFEMIEEVSNIAFETATGKACGYTKDAVTGTAVLKASLVATGADLK